MIRTPCTASHLNGYQLISNRDHKPSRRNPVRRFQGALRWLNGLPRRSLDWLCAGRADYRAFQRRRQTRSYQIKRGHCKTLWILAGGVMIWHPTLPVIFICSLVTSLVCFALLDETG